ncbi:hypothetical protein HRW19_17840 [Streptomyces lunaelactis]|nr:hypothetical protein [Streptomyces lunaelactis]
MRAGEAGALICQEACPGDTTVGSEYLEYRHGHRRLTRPGEPAIIVWAVAGA